MRERVDLPMRGIGLSSKSDPRELRDRITRLMVDRGDITYNDAKREILQLDAEYRQSRTRVRNLGAKR